VLVGTTGIPSGGTLTVDVPKKSETEFYQCLIHPWMQTTVTVKK
jgi:hypothetical protein